MRTAKRLISISLTAVLIFQAIAPSTEAFAQELDVIRNSPISGSYGVNGAAEGIDDTNAQLSGDSQDETADSSNIGLADSNASTASPDGNGGSAEGAVGSVENTDAAGDADAGQTDDAASGDAATQAEDASRAAEPYAFSTIEELNAALSGKGSASDSAIIFNDQEALILISNANPSVYENATITRGGTSGAQYDVTGTASCNGNTYSFRGLGDDGYPFAGTFNASGSSIITDTSFYNNLSLSDGNKSISLTWKGTSSDPLVAKKVTGNGKQFDASITLAASGVDNPKASDPAITSALFGEVSGALSVKVGYTFEATRKGIGITVQSGNAGLIANTLNNGATFAIVQITGLENADAAQSVTAADGNAGALVGDAGDGSTVTVKTSVDVSKFTVKASNAAGGFIGNATKLTLNFYDEATIKPALNVGASDTSYAGGAIGFVSFAGKCTVKNSWFNFDGTVELGTKKRAGGLFGSLDLSNGDVVIEGGTYKSELTEAGDDNNNRGAYGGVAGNVCSNNSNTIHALSVKKSDDQKVGIEIKKSANLFYTGGIVGYTGDNLDNRKQKAAVILDGTQVVCNGGVPHTSNAKFGGAVGVVDTNQLLDIRDFKVKTAEGVKIGDGASGGTAGIAGSAWRGILKLSGTTDLSEAEFANNDRTAQILYQNYNALVFATGSGDNDGWKYLRPTMTVAIDDIFDYGQVIRLGSNLSNGLIKVNETTHELDLGTALAKTGDAYVLNNVDDFAKLAITWQTFGYFSMVDNVGSNNFSGLLTSKIKVAGAIDLAGTGLMGIAKDRTPIGGSEGSQEDGEKRAEKNCAFAGTLIGTGSINLAVGESYGMRNGSALGANDASDGNGKIYRHGRLGLFNELAGATVEDSVTIGGTMKFDAKSDINAGALAAVRTGDNTSVAGLTVTTSITYDNTDENRTENIGGIFGQVTGGGTIDFASGVSAKPTITSRVQDQGYVRAAAAIGYIAKESTVTVNAAAITVGGSITVSDYKKDTLVGGFIAYIRQDEASLTAGETKTINITGLSFDRFEMTVNAQNSSNKNVGGLLGYSWGNAIVDFTGVAEKYALSASNANVTATNATGGFGGLVYAASGYWKINDYAINLSRAKFSAPGADAFGMLVCRAGSSRDANDKVGVDALTGLYLKNTAPWATAYNVSDSVDAISTSATTFDEWVADTKRSGSKIDDILANGVVSLHTWDEKLNMSGDASKCNSYENRTAYGKNHQTNASARYYYNLGRAVKSATYNGNWITNAEGLLLWSAWRYAPEGVRSYVIDGLAAGNSSIQDTLRVDGDIDLSGYSYYPVGNNGGNAFLRGSLTFCYKEIAETEKGNKRNNVLSQHSNMHLSVFGGFASSSKSNMTLMVGSSDKALTLKGTIGKDVISGNSGSGALISGSLVGIETSGTIAAVSTAGKGMVLDGLTVWTEGSLDDGGSSPLLVNVMPSYASLTVNNLSVKAGSYSSGTKAATSLFGTLGGSNADMVSASFNNIAVPSLKDSSIFTHASFLESFGYKVGGNASANYIFYKEDADKSNVTYGNEIDANGASNEYVGMQLWYYDDSTYGLDTGLVKKGNQSANVDNPVFGDYLPYVFKGKSDTAYHEIKVNQRVPSLVLGCGTYGDPYVVKTASQINALTNYINLGSAVDDWEVTIVKDQETLCARRSDGSTDNETTYVYKSGSWTEKNGTETLTNDVMHLYLQSAYYSIEPEDSGNGHNDSIELNTTDFTGFGNKSNPFRGVIVGGLKKRGGSTVSTSLVINNDEGKTIQGLIPYSYGSVIKDLGITYSGSANSIEYADKNSVDGVPASFFGGIIGCILGGDNIIDGVTVSADGFTVAASGNKSHLVAVGGYVGAIAGGGVVFRNMTGDSWLKDDSNANDAGVLYTNPYVGRVIDGFAFSEGCDVDNGDKNYKVNKLTAKGTACVETGDCTNRYKDNYTNPSGNAITTTVENAQGMLVLSAIISSGAGGGSSYTYLTDDDYGSFNGSKAYAGRTAAVPEAYGSYRFGNDTLGKVRNASYDQVGKPADASNDFTDSVEDDRVAPGTDLGYFAGALDNGDEGNVNSPYLVKYYATWQTGNVCAPKASGMDLQFADGTYDMRDYGTGFTGLSGRYYSNACASSYGADRDRIVPQIACINGNGAKVLLKSDVQQYLDDDYFLQSWGGLLSAVEFTNTWVSNSLNSEAQGGYLVRDLQFGDGSTGVQGSSVSLTCIKSDGTSASYNDLTAADAVDKDSQNGMPHMGVGVLAGSTANREALSGEGEGKFKGVKLVNCKVASISMSGGLFGNSGWAKRRKDLDRNRMISFETQVSPVRLYDCIYSGVEVEGATRVGGFVGAVGGDGSVAGMWAITEGVTLGGDKSTITSTQKDSIVGGAFGLCWSAVKVNVDDNGSLKEAYKMLTFKNVTVKNQGVIGNANSVFEGTGGLIGDPKEGCAVARVTISSDKPASNSDATCIQSTQTSQSMARRVGGVVGQIDAADKDYSFTDVTVSNIKLSAHDSCGGVVGHMMNNVKIVCDGITIDGVCVDGTYSGGIAGAIASSSAEVSVSNSTIRNASFTKSENGGIAGDGRGKFLLANVLLDKNDFASSQVKKQGVILGSLAIDGFKGIYASGIDIIPAQISGKNENAALPQLINGSEDDVKAANQKSYIAFSDYTDVLDAVLSDSLYGDGGIDVESANPYVTTNPVNGKVKIQASGDSTSQKSIFGDGSKVDTAATIQSEAGTTVPGRYTYTNIGGRADGGSYKKDNAYSAASSQSTFNDNNVKADSKKVGTDFPVLLIPGNDSTTVTNYLNIVTNGGFSDAVRLNGGTEGTRYVTATAESMTLSDDGKYFVKSTDTPSLRVADNGESSMRFYASTSWDNEKSRFTLLTVTFDNGSGHTYKVQVPIIVKRMLEINFTATYSYGTNFNKASYEALGNNAHVLSSAGDAMAGYLTWEYNVDSAGQHTEYGWQSHLDAGGSMRPLNKTIEFKGEGAKGTLPEGTQLTLVDTANNDKAYSYTVGAGGAASVALTAFEDSGGNPFQEKWMSEIMGVTAKSDSSGKWKKITEGEDTTDAVAKVDGAYYRLPKDNEKGDTTLSVDETAAGTPSENFYLIIRVPSGTNTSVNGYTATAVNSNINTNITCVLRPKDASGNTVIDGQQNTASTYSIASSYKQTLTDLKKTTDGNGQPTDAVVAMAPDSTTLQYDGMKMDVLDTVTFGDNEYNDTDTLYYQLDSSLNNYVEAALSSAAGYPVGTTATVTFYVKVNGEYYTWNRSGDADQKWKSAGQTETAVTAAMHWAAEGKDMSLVLSDKIGPIDLSGIRKIAKSNGGKFEIEMKADLLMTEPAAIAGISASKDKAAETYTKPSYRSFLSPHADMLSTSSMSATNEGGVRYYRESDDASSKISLTASLVSQLGINIDDLQSADGTIALTGRYDFTDAKEGTAKLSAGTQVVYTLSLQRRQDDGSYSDMAYGNRDNISNYISVVDNNQGLPVGTKTDSIVFTDEKTGGKFATRDGDSLALVLGFRVKVNTNVESAGQFYSNYRLVLTARLTGDGVDDTPRNAQGLTGYDNSDYVTYTLTRVNTSGIPH